MTYLIPLRYTVTCDCCYNEVEFDTQADAKAAGWDIPDTLRPTDTWSDGWCPECGPPEEIDEAA